MRKRMGLVCRCVPAQGVVFATPSCVRDCEEMVRCGEERVGKGGWLMRRNRQRGRDWLEQERLCYETDGEVSYLEESGLHTEGIESQRKMAQERMAQGDFYVAAGLWMRAVHLWKDAIDWLEFVDGFWDFSLLSSGTFMRFDNVVAREEATELGRRIDAVWTQLGHPEMGGSAKKVENNYKWLWMEIFEV